MFRDTFQRRSYIAEYIRAVENEISIDIDLYKLSALDPKDFSYLPRPTKWHSRVVRFRRIMPLLSKAVKLIWNCGGFFLFLVYEYIYFLIYSISKDKTCYPVGHNNTVGLAFSERACEVIKAPNIKNAVSYWVVMPWVPIKNHATSTEKIDIFSMLTGWDLFRACKYAILASFQVLLIKEIRCWSLQTYTAFRWFAVRFAINKLSGDIYIAEHYDRWAVLADCAACGTERFGNKTNRIRLHLVQHGYVGNPSDSKKLDVALRYRLRAVAHLHVYDRASEDIFKESILSPDNSMTVLVSYFTPHIHLTSKATLDRKSILIVGHPICESFQIELYKMLAQHNDIIFFYKPHPTVPFGEVVARQNWTLITERDHFPRVSLLVSYPSTLVSEYEAQGIPSFIHSMRSDAHDLCNVFRAIRLKFPELFDRDL